MNSKKISFFALLLITSHCFSQENQVDVRDVTKVTFLSPGISYEKRVSRFQSIYGQVSMSISFSFSYSSTFGTTSYFSLDPALTVQYRYYYNAEKRQSKGKRTEMNSLNYLCPILEIYFSKDAISTSHYVENNRRAITSVGLAWGFQRNYKKRFSLDFNWGVGYLFAKATLPNNAGQTITERVAQFTTVGQFNLGFWLNKIK